MWYRNCGRNMQRELILEHTRKAPELLRIIPLRKIYTFPAFKLTSSYEQSRWRHGNMELALVSLKATSDPKVTSLLHDRSWSGFWACLTNMMLEGPNPLPVSLPWLTLNPPLLWTGLQMDFPRINRASADGTQQPCILIRVHKVSWTACGLPLNLTSASCATVYINAVYPLAYHIWRYLTAIDDGPSALKWDTVSTGK